MLTILTLAALAAPERTHDIVPDDLAAVRSIGGFTVSPRGRRVIYQERRWSLEADRSRADLYMVDLDGGAPQRLTFGPGSAASPRFLPDGEHIVYAGSVKRVGQKQAPWDGTRQVWRMPIDGGDPVPLTESEDGIDAYDLTADTSTLWYSVSSKHPYDDSFASLRTSHGGPNYGHAPADTSTLWRMDTTSWRAEEVFGGERTIYAFDVSPDGTRVAMLTTPDSELVWHEGWSQVDILDVATGEVTTLDDSLWRESGPSPYGWLGDLTWKHDSSQIAFTVGYDGYPTELYVAATDGTVREVTMTAPTSLNGSVGWMPSRDDLCFTVADQARLRLHCAGKDGTLPARDLTPGDAVTVWDWAASDNGKVVVTKRGGLDHLGDLFVGTGSKSARLTTVNPQLDTWKLPSVQLITWTAPDGTPVEGVLELPPGWTPADGPLPTVVHIHGGPTWATPYQLSFRGYGQTVFSAQGWAVLSPNYRGSLGYGDEFLTQLVGRENDIEVADILAGVDHLIAEGITDGEKLGVLGWSNGGYLTNCLITQTDRFKAASSGAGVFDQTIQWATEDTPGHVVNFMEGLPWDQPEHMISASPLFAADQIQTPTVIHVGEHDPRVPAAHARALFRALNVYLDVDTELLVYPGEGHGLSKYSHKAAKMAWDLAWFDHHVLGEPPEGESDEATEDADAPETE
jgi:dipeptidyl aminopeptidase/acylaminoacyl peptidase